MPEKKKTKSVSEREKWQFVHALVSPFIQRRAIYAAQLVLLSFDWSNFLDFPDYDSY
jgi:hypothetical protein